MFILGRAEPRRLKNITLLRRIFLSLEKKMGEEETKVLSWPESSEFSVLSPVVLHK